MYTILNKNLKAVDAFGRSFFKIFLTFHINEKNRKITVKKKEINEIPTYAKIGY